MISSRFSELFSITSTNSRFSSSKSVFFRSSVKPIIPFNGVLISCDMFAKNILFAALASSAFTFSIAIFSIALSIIVYAEFIPAAVLKSTFSFVSANSPTLLKMFSNPCTFFLNCPANRNPINIRINEIIHTPPAPAS